MQTRPGTCPLQVRLGGGVNAQGPSPCCAGHEGLTKASCRQVHSSQPSPSVLPDWPHPDSGLKVSPLFSVVMTVASSGSPQPCLVLADSLKMYADSGASSVAVNCLTVAPTSTVVNVLGLLLARR